MPRVIVMIASALLVSCASVPKADPPDRIRVAIADIESKESLGGPALAESVREHLQGQLFAVRRFEVLERRHLDRAMDELNSTSRAKAGALVGADWVVYGVITQESGGAHIHLRVIRVETGVISYSGSRLVAGAGESDLRRGAGAAVGQLVNEISVLPR